MGKLGNCLGKKAALFRITSPSQEMKLIEKTFLWVKNSLKSLILGIRKLNKFSHNSWCRLVYLFIATFLKGHKGYEKWAPLGKGDGICRTWYQIGGTLPSDVSLHGSSAVCCLHYATQAKEGMQGGRQEEREHGKQEKGWREGLMWRKQSYSWVDRAQSTHVPLPDPLPAYSSSLLMLCCHSVCSRLTDFLFLGHTHLFPISTSLHTRSSLCVDPILTLSPHPGQASALLVPLCLNWQSLLRASPEPLFWIRDLLARYSITAVFIVCNWMCIWMIICLISISPSSLDAPCQWSFTFYPLQLTGVQ